MFSTKSFLVALAKAIPEALVISHNSDRGFIIQRGSKATMIPEFQVSRGFILGDGGMAPVQDPPLTEDQELEACVEAVVAHRRSIYKSCVVNGSAGPFRTLISVNERCPPDSVTIGLWVY